MGFAQRNRELQGLSFQNTFSQNYIQNFMKTLENYILGPFWALFAYFRTSTNFPKKTHFCHFFSVSRFLSLCKNFHKCNEQNLRKTGYRHAERCTNKHEFKRPPLPGRQKFWCYIDFQVLFHYYGSKIETLLNICKGFPQLFPGKIATTIFSLKIEFKQKGPKVFFCVNGPKIQLGVLILEGVRLNSHIPNKILDLQFPLKMVIISNLSCISYFLYIVYNQ